MSSDTKVSKEKAPPIPEEGGELCKHLTYRAWHGSNEVSAYERMFH